MMKTVHPAQDIKRMRRETGSGIEGRSRNRVVKTKRKGIPGVYHITVSYGNPLFEFPYLQHDKRMTASAWVKAMP